ncbi:MAG: hypothetical protein A2682_03695 [Candidatus Terrybacteria bacterium RIFCSPHIGHO2_01_FULL_58_15]|uniref:Fibronectin type-III domain-containing protein n=1 Tax=Terrybacteria sp. (strain RIFCSPHIGHO2_01_FULL_58_15) TaxID=1802363 RepID=A0A1G2PMP8_TERXR|nr:MAG: hypothetical protein A2682_03695 [Candidatus Terrybacteria bacterium RIFCSPHIGHO2_01_FULL_58_15]
MARKILRRLALLFTLPALLFGPLGGGPVWLSPLPAEAAAPVFTNNGAAGGNVPQGNTNLVGLDITLPPIDADTFLDGDGDASTAAGAAGAIAAGDALVQLVNSGTTLCGNTNGATAPTNIVHDADGNCIGDVGVRTVILGADTGATNDLGSNTTSLIGFRDIDGNDGGTYSLAEDDDLYLDTDYSEKYNADTIDAVTVGNLGTAVNATDISGVQWWFDNGNGQFSPAEDTIADSVCPWNGASGHWECGDNVNVTYTVAGVALRIFVTFGIATTAVAGKTVQMRIPASFDFDGDGVFDTTDRGIFFSNNGGAATGNHDGPAGNIDNVGTATIILRASGNTSAPPPSSSDTSGGTSEPAPTNTETKTISSTDGGTVTETSANDGATATVTVEEGTTTEDTTFTVQAFTAQEVYAQKSLPSVLAMGAQSVFDISAAAGGQSVTTFAEKPLALSFTYQENRLAQGVSENDLRLATFDEAEKDWHVLEDAVLDTGTNRVTYDATHFSRFALVRPMDIALPSPPTDLSASVVSAAVRLAWQNPAEDFHHARILRSTAPDPSTLLRTNVQASQYDDATVLSGAKYYYAVAAVDRAGNISTAVQASIVASAAASPQALERAASPEDAAVADGELVRADGDSRVFVVRKRSGFTIIRHFVDAVVPTFYGHLGANFWAKVRSVGELGAARPAAWVRCGDCAGADSYRVWEVNADGSRHWMDMTWQHFVVHTGNDAAFTDAAISVINRQELEHYTPGPSVTFQP